MPQHGDACGCGGEDNNCGRKERGKRRSEGTIAAVTVVSDDGHWKFVVQMNTPVDQMYTCRQTRW